MKKHLSNYFTALSIFGSLILPAQNQKWFFGGNAGVDFSTSPPTSINGGMLATYEGEASMSDANGNLLFYTNGKVVYDQTHQLMANGSGLNGDLSTTQSALIIKQPGNATIYYIFTLDKEGGAAGLSYSLVDMSLAAGIGSVTVKNILVYAPSAEKLCATRHCNGTDIWILTHELYSNIFRAYLLTSAGLSLTPINSALSVSINAPAPDTFGQMKFSPSGKKLGLSHFAYSRMELYDFNNSTGTLSNLVILSTSLSSPYGCEFSPDGTKLYGSEFLSGRILQWDACAGSSSAIIGSLQTFTNPSGLVVYGSMQLAADGKIYVARNGLTDLGVINNPDLAGIACNFVDAGLSIAPNTCSLGLPGFLSNTAKKMPLPFTFAINPALSCQSASFTASPTPTLNTSCSASSNTYSGSYWIFGDPLSGASNTSTASNPTHVYSASGFFYPKLIFTSSCGSDTVTKVLNLSKATLTVIGKTTICKGEKTDLTAFGATSYTWSVPANTNTVSVHPTSTMLYTVTGINAANPCPGTKTVNISVIPCLGVNAFVLNSQFQSYPNPFKESLTLTTSLPTQVILYNHLGDAVFQKSLESGLHTFNLKDLENGIYILKAYNSDGTKLLRLVKLQP